MLWPWVLGADVHAGLAILGVFLPFYPKPAASPLTHPASLALFFFAFLFSLALVFLFWGFVFVVIF